MKGSMSLCNWRQRGIENRQVPGKVWAPAGCRMWGSGGVGVRVGGMGGLETGLVPRGGNPISERVAVKVNPCWATFHKSMRGLYRETCSHCCKQAHADSHHPLTHAHNTESGFSGTNYYKTTYLKIAIGITAVKFSSYCYCCPSLFLVQKEMCKTLVKRKPQPRKCSWLDIVNLMLKKRKRKKETCNNGNVFEI